MIDAVKQWFQVEGVAVPSDELVEVGEGRWVVPTPVNCLVGGHRLEVDTDGHRVCSTVATTDRTGHYLYWCECGEVTYVPEREPDCACRRTMQPPPVLGRDGLGSAGE